VCRGLRDALQKAPGFAAAVAGAVGPNEYSATLLPVPRTVAILVAVAGDDAVHTRRPLDGDGAAPRVAVAGTVGPRVGHRDLEVFPGG